jgi:hypothetical protein
LQWTTCHSADFQDVAAGLELYWLLTHELECDQGLRHFAGGEAAGIQHPAAQDKKEMARMMAWHDDSSNSLLSCCKLKCQRLFPSF